LQRRLIGNSPSIMHHSFGVFFLSSISKISNNFFRLS
jgi:hypothetical protein